MNRARVAGPIALPQLAAAPQPTDRGRFTRWRVRVLILVHLLIAVHIAQWLVMGRTLAPLELNEAVYTLEAGIITAGAILMALIMASVLVFGRFFCSWACHVLALQDGAAWLLRTLRIPARPVRSRVLVWIAPVAMLYMFVWPQAVRLWEGRPMPALHLRSDAEGWASLMTEDFTRNLPGPGIGIATLVVCGGVIVWVLGSRSFCQFVCPYGSAFRVVEPLAPGRITVDPAKCTDCGVCTSVCESHVRVHEEVALHGRVVDPMCLKDLDCVAACPEDALSFRFTRPAGVRSLRPARTHLRPDYSWTEEAVIAVCCVAGVLSFRGLYGLGPFFLAMVLGALIGFAAVLGWRLVETKADVRFSGIQLKRQGRMRRAGWGAVACCALAVAFLGHCGFIRAHEWAARRALTRASQAIEAGATDPAAVIRDAHAAGVHLDLVQRWGLLLAPDHWRLRAAAAWGEGDDATADAAWARVGGTPP